MKNKNKQMNTDLFKPLMHIATGMIMFCMLNSPVFSQDPVDYVNPYIGSVGHLLTATTPDVQLPRGMVRLIPRTTPGIRDIYLADRIYSFSVRSLSNDFSVGDFCIMPVKGEIKQDPKENSSCFDHDMEIVKPYYYSVLLEDFNIKAEYTVADHSAFYRFTFPESERSGILTSILQKGEITITGDDVIEGFMTSPYGRDQGRRFYFYSKFSKPISTFGSWSPEYTLEGERQKSGNNTGIWSSFSTTGNEVIHVKTGFSFISTGQARENMEKEIPGWDFEELKERGRKIWNDALGKIRVKGGTIDQRIIFYTALYRVFGRKTTNVSEYGKYYSIYDEKVHETEGSDFYQLGESWGSCRSLFPLGIILEPERQNDIVNSWIRAYEQCGFLGDAALNRRVMIGRHETVSVTDAYFKGFRNYDVEKAYAGMKKNATEVTMIPWRNGPLTGIDSIYSEKGFFPALPLGAKEWIPQVHSFEKRQAVSVTLEHCWDDWCLAQMAGELNKPDDQKYFSRRSENYRNLYDPGIGFMAPKTTDGNWVFSEKDLDPVWSGGQGGRDYYTETNAWTYLFHVQQDINGLIDLMGGKNKLSERLDGLFQEQFRGKGPKYEFLRQFPDMTGLIGQYHQGNQPGYHIPYLYNYSGEPWKTQKIVREIMKIWYNDSPLGICGDEDEGETSSWFVFSSMGFFPVCPGKPVYDIGSPVFRKITIDTGNGRKFIIEADGVSDKNKFIQSATLNGKPLNTPWFSHSDLTDGGKLILKMGPLPNKIRE